MVGWLMRSWLTCGCSKQMAMGFCARSWLSEDVWKSSLLGRIDEWLLGVGIMC